MALAILAAPAAHSWMRTQAGILRPALGAMPVLTNEWQGPLPANERWRPEFIGPSAERRAAYSSAAGRVEVYVNVYGEQEQGRELVFYRNSTTPSEQWSQIGSLPETAATLRAKLVVHASQQQWIVAETYHVGGWSTPSAALAQISYGALSLRRPAPAGLIAIAAPCAPDCDSARALLVSFWGAEGERLTGLIPAVMDPDARSAQ
jgi:EpsI family protein